MRINATQERRNTNRYPSKRPKDQPLLGKQAKWVEKQLQGRTLSLSGGNPAISKNTEERCFYFPSKGYDSSG
ncbi:hypothetical protein PTT_17992 [Pyrenophora teres f. teres 0-1]|uniref:Uncharacterized protein n=1 Tax=Pyrenophora teres f. teres (strain 0-1) TaxID=861557 RepID=E3S5Q5_PYRTT|nr:hypothetical protein PTT_17992 [Pyrenophora teres f. teres 0-1]